MLRNLLTVDHHERTKRVLTSDAEALQPLRSVIHDLNARNVFQELAHRPGRGPADVVRRDDGDAHRNVFQFLRDTARGHNDFTGFFRGFSRSGGCRESRGGERGDEREMMLSLHLLLIPCWNRDPLHGVPSL